MPSAMIEAPRSPAKEISPEARARRAGSLSMFLVRVMSSLMMSGLSLRMCRKLANPAPASSTASRHPVARRGSRFLASAS